jgi:hypothetical protein
MIGAPLLIRRGEDKNIHSPSESAMDSTSFRKIEIEEIVAMVRLNRYNRGRTHGANAILQEMESMGVRPLPSRRTIARILTHLGLSSGRTGHYP